MSEEYAGQQIVGIDLHRRRSVIVRMTEAGEHLETVRILNDRERLAAVMALKDSNLGRHQPTDLQNGATEAATCNYRTDRIARAQIGHGQGHRRPSAGDLLTGDLALPRDAPA